MLWLLTSHACDAQKSGKGSEDSSLKRTLQSVQGLHTKKQDTTRSHRIFKQTFSDKYELKNFCKIWGFHGGDYEEWCLLGCYAGFLQEPHGLTTQKTPFFKNFWVYVISSRNPELLVLCWLAALLTIQPWRWRLYIFLKCLISMRQEYYHMRQLVSYLRRVANIDWGMQDTDCKVKLTQKETF
jgi:hypothetical protein